MIQHQNESFLASPEDYKYWISTS